MSGLMRQTILAILTGAVLAAATHAGATGIDPRIDAGVNALWVMPSNKVLRGNNDLGRRVVASTVPFVELTARCDTSSRYGRWYPMARQGVGVAVQPVIPTGVLGTPVLAYVKQGAPFKSLSPRWSLDYEWNFGAAMGWKAKDHDAPGYDRDKDCIGSPYTAYINIGLYARYRLTDGVSIFGGVDLRHYSNGNTVDPNPGINMLGLRVGASVSLEPKTPVAKADWSDFRPGYVVDVVVYGAWRKRAFHAAKEDGDDKEYEMIPGRFGVVGLNVNPMYRFNPVVSAGLSVDAHFDEGANLAGHYIEGTPLDDPRFKRPSFADRSTVGLSARAELRMAMFGINVGVGHSLIAPGGSDLRGWYCNFALKTFVSERVFIHTGYRLVKFTYQGNLLLGLGYRF